MRKWPYVGMGEDGGDVEATWALNIHEETVWGLDKSLQLVLALFFRGRWVK
jgi:hypothetical protein